MGILLMLILVVVGVFDSLSNIFANAVASGVPFFGRP